MGRNSKFIRYQSSGVTLIELAITVLLIGIIFSVAPKFFTAITRFIRTNTARVEIQRDARDSLAMINRQLRQARAISVVVTRHPTIPEQPPYSKIQFETVSDRDYEFYQENRNLFMTVDAGPRRKIAGNLKYLAFSYPRAFDPTILSVTVTFEKSTYSGHTKALQMAIEKVRVMND